jgi:hypothetical protein
MWMWWQVKGFNSIPGGLGDDNRGRTWVWLSSENHVREGGELALDRDNKHTLLRTSRLKPRLLDGHSREQGTDDQS